MTSESHRSKPAYSNPYPSTSHNYNTARSSSTKDIVRTGCRKPDYVNARSSSAHHTTAAITRPSSFTDRSKPTDPKRNQPQPYKSKYSGCSSNVK